MKKLRILIMMILVVALCISASTQNNKEDDDGVSKDPNHPWTVHATRENVRAERGMNAIHKMLIEAYDKDEEAIRRLNAARDAWIQYRDAEIASETAMYAGGHPEQEKRELVSAELTRERTARMKKMLNEMVNGNEARAPERLKPKIQKMLKQIEKMESAKKSKSDKK